jgi:hypothetical protein
MPSAHPPIRIDLDHPARNGNLAWLASFREAEREVIDMFDALYLAIGIGVFLVITLYVFVCDRL